MIKDDLLRFLSCAVYTIWDNREDPGTYSSVRHFFGERSQDTDSLKRSLEFKISKDMHLSLIKNLFPNYDQYIKCFTESVPKKDMFIRPYVDSKPIATDGSVWIPCCEAFPKGDYYKMSCFSLPPDLFSKIDNHFFDSVDIKIEVMSVLDVEKFYPYNFEVSYNRNSTLKTWANGRFKSVYGTVKMVTSYRSALSPDVICAVMCILCRAYNDMLSLLADSSYRHVLPTKWGRRYQNKTKSQLLDSHSPCLKLLGDLLERTSAIPDMTSLMGLNLDIDGNSPEILIKGMEDIIVKDSVYNYLETIEKDIEEFKDLMRYVSRDVLCQMWNRCCKVKVYSVKEIPLFLKSRLDEIKDQIFFLLAVKIVHEKMRFKNYGLY